MLLRSAGLLFLFALQAARADELSCDFRKPCCWHSLNDDSKWQIRSGRTININEFRRTFLVGRSRSPPAGNYLLQNDFDDLTSFGSCPFCSSDSHIYVQYRHWQSPTARLKLCWRRWGQAAIRAENCHPAEPSRQSQVISQKLVVPVGVDVQVLFVLEKLDGSVNTVVMIDRILMSVKHCATDGDGQIAQVPRTVRISVPPSLQTSEKALHAEATGLHQHSPGPSSLTLDLPQLALVDERVRMKLLDRQKERELFKLRESEFSLKSKERRKSGEVKSGETRSRSSEDLASTADVSSPPPLLTSLPVKRIAIKPPKRFVSESEKLFGVIDAVVPPPSPPAKPGDFDPLTDLLGKELVNFLDPNYVTNDEEEADYDEKGTEPTKDTGISKKLSTGSSKPTDNNTIKQKHIASKTGPTVVQTPSPLMMFHRPLSLTPPQPCHTVGGCLFDRSMCSYSHPPEIPVSSHFVMLKVGLSNFVRARVPPGSSSVLQTETSMSDPHTIFFDVLEWKQGTRLVACCSDMYGVQQCPFATPSTAGVLLWQSASFDCPAFTTQIRFICENFGNEDGECGLDSIRLHRLSDTFLLEPCQKHILSSL